MIFHKYKHIEVVYSQYIESIDKMFEEYYDTEEYDDTLFLLNSSWVQEESRFVTKSDLPEHRHYIYYNLEHYETFFGNYSYWGFKMFIPWLLSMKFDELWDFSYENIKMMSDTIKAPIKFVPVRYTSSIIDDPLDIPKQNDICFLGVVNNLYPHRVKLIGDIQDMLFKFRRNTRIKTLSGDDMVNFKDEISNCKYMLDTLNVSKNFEYPTTQNQIRIFECIMRGYKVISENVTGVNYFENLIDILQFPVDSTMESGVIYGGNIIELLNREYVDDHVMIREKYREMTQSDEAFENYKQNIIEKYNKIWY